MCLPQSVSVSISPYGPSAGTHRIQLVTWTTTRSGVPKEAGTAAGPRRWSLRSPTGHRARLGSCGGSRKRLAVPKPCPPPRPSTQLSGYIPTCRWMLQSTGPADSFPVLLHLEVTPPGPLLLPCLLTNDVYRTRDGKRSSSTWLDRNEYVCVKQHVLRLMFCKAISKQEVWAANTRKPVSEGLLQQWHLVVSQKQPSEAGDERRPTA